MVRRSDHPVVPDTAMSTEHTKQVYLLRIAVLFLFALCGGLLILVAAIFLNGIPVSKDAPSSAPVVHTNAITNTSHAVTMNDNLYLTSLRNVLVLGTDEDGKVIAANVSFDNNTTIVVTHVLSNETLERLTITDELKTALLKLLELPNAPTLATDGYGNVIQGPSYNADGNGTVNGETQLVAYGDQGKITTGEGGLLVAGDARVIGNVTLDHPLAVSQGGSGSNESLTPWCIKYGLNPYQEACLPPGSTSELLGVSNGTLKWMNVTVTGTPNEIVVQQTSGHDFVIGLAVPLVLQAPLSVTSGGTGSNESLTPWCIKYGLNENQETCLPPGSASELLGTFNGTLKWVNLTITGTTGEIVVEETDDHQFSVRIANPLVLPSPLSVASGGRGVGIVDNHALQIGGEDVISSLDLGTTGQLLAGNTDANPTWTSEPSITAITLAEPLAVSSGGTSTSSMPVNRIVMGNGTGAFYSLDAGHQSEVLVGGSPPTWVNLSTVAVTELSGTDNEITVSQGSGQVILSLPSPFVVPGVAEITTSISSPMVVLTGDTNGTVTLKADSSGSDYTLVFPSEIAANGQVMYAEVVGVEARMHWRSAVTSLEGTENQIDVTTDTGDVILSLPLNLLAPGNITANGSTSAKQMVLRGETEFITVNLPATMLSSYDIVLPPDPAAEGQTLFSNVSTGRVALSWKSVVTSLNGTQGQISVTSYINDIVLSIPPEFIAPGSVEATTSVTAGSLRIRGLDSGVVAIETPNSTDSYVVVLPAQIATTNQVLVANVTGDVVSLQWKYHVSSVSGTEHQIQATSGTGDITLSLPSQLIAPGSIEAVTNITTPSLRLKGKDGGYITLDTDIVNETYTVTFPSGLPLAHDHLVVGSFDGTTASLEWSNEVTFDDLNLETPLDVDDGGTGKRNHTGHSLLVGNGADPIGEVAPGLAGQVLVGVTDSDPVWSGSPVLTSVSASAINVVASVSGSVVIDTGSTVTVPYTITLPVGEPFVNGIPQVTSYSSTVAILEWTDAPTLASLTLLDPLSVPCGGVARTTLSMDGILFGNGTSPVGVTAPGNNTQVLIGGSPPRFETMESIMVTELSGTTNEIDVTNGGIGHVTIQLPSALIAPGSIEAVTNITTPLVAVKGSNANTISVATGSVPTSYAIHLPTGEPLTNGVLQVASYSAQTATMAWSATPTFTSLNLTNALGVPFGGTGVSSHTPGGLLFGDGASAIQATAAGASSQVLIGGTVPSWTNSPSIVSLTLSTALAVTSGGTGQTSHTLHGIVVGSGTSALATTSAGASGTVLIGTTGGPPSFSTSPVVSSIGTQLLQLNGTTSGSVNFTAAATTADYTIVYPSTPALNSQTLRAGVSGSVVTLSWNYFVASAAGTANQISVNSATGAVTFSLSSTLVAPGSIQSKTFLVAASTTGTITIKTGTSIATDYTLVLPVGEPSANAIPQISSYSSQVATVVWTDTPTFAGLTLSSPLSVAGGGSGVATHTQYGVLFGNGTSPVASTSAGTSFQVLVGSTGGAPTFSSNPLLSSVQAGSFKVAGSVSGTITINTGTTVSSSYTVTLPVAQPSVSSVLQVTSYAGNVATMVWTATPAFTLVQAATFVVAAGTSGSVSIVTGSTVSTPYTISLPVGVPAAGALLEVSTFTANVATMVWTTSPLSVSKGGSGVTSFTSGGVLYGNGASAIQVTAAGATGTVLVGGTTPTFSASPSLTSITLSTPLSVGGGGTGASSYIQYGLLYGDSTSSIKVTAAGDTNRVLIGNTGGAPTWSTNPAVTSVTTGTTSMQSGYVLSSAALTVSSVGSLYIGTLGTTGIATGLDGKEFSQHYWYCGGSGSPAFRIRCGTAATITSLTRSSCDVTVTTSAAHGFTVGTWVSINGCNPSGYNSLWQIVTVPTTTTFIFTVTSCSLTTPATSCTWTKPYLGVSSRHNVLDDGQGNMDVLGYVSTPSARITGTTSGTIAFDTGATVSTSYTVRLPTGIPLVNGILQVSTYSSNIATMAWTATPTFTSMTLTGALTLGTDLAVGDGGTGVSTFISDGVLYGNGASAIQVTSAGGAGTVLIGGSPPSFSSSPTITSPTITTLTLTNDLTVANGGTGVSSFTANGMLYGNGASAIQVTAAGGAGTVLIGGSPPSFSSSPTITSPTITTLTLTNDLSVPNGGTGVSAITQYGLVYGNAASAIGATAAGTTGQVLIGNTGAAPTWSAAPSVTSITTGSTVMQTGLIHTVGDMQLRSTNNLHIARDNGVFVTVGVNNPDFSLSYWYCGNSAGSNFRINCGASATVTSITRSTCTATVTTSAAHGYSTGQWVNVMDCTPSGYNGMQQILSTPTSTTFTYTVSDCGLTTPATTCTYVKTIGSVSTRLNTLDDGKGVMTLTGSVSTPTVIVRGTSSGTITFDTGSTVSTSYTVRLPTGIPLVNGILQVSTYSSNIATMVWTASPTFTSLSLTTQLSVANGGTGAITLANNGVLIGKGTSAISATAVGATGEVLVGNTGAAPTWSSSLTLSSLTLSTDLAVADGGTGVSSFTANGVLYGNGASAIQVTAAGGAGTVLIGGSPPSFSSSPTITSPTITTLTLTNDLTVANGGTGASSFTANGMLYGNGASAIQVTGAGGAGTVLVGGSPPTFSSTPTITTLSLTNDLAVSHGGTGVSSILQYGVVYGNGASAIGVTAAGTTGTVLIGTTTSAPSFSAAPVVTSIQAQQVKVAGTSSGTVTIDAGASVSPSWTYRLPSAVGTAGQQLSIASVASNVATMTWSNGIQADVQDYTTAGSYTWTKPAGTIVQMQFLLIGGGGGGGGGSLTKGVAPCGGDWYSGGAGGAPGRLIYKIVAFPPLTQSAYPVVVGVAGTAGTHANPPTAGGNGGDSSFGNSTDPHVYYVANGGAGGTKGTCGTTAVATGKAVCPYIGESYDTAGTLCPSDTWGANDALGGRWGTAQSRSGMCCATATNPGGGNGGSSVGSADGAGGGPVVAMGAIRTTVTPILAGGTNGVVGNGKGGDGQSGGYAFMYAGSGGGGGSDATSGTQCNGGNGGDYGGGGGGGSSLGTPASSACTNRNGGAGGKGRVIITTLYIPA